MERTEERLVETGRPQPHDQLDLECLFLLQPGSEDEELEPWCS